MRTGTSAVITVLAVTVSASGAERGDYRLRYHTPPTSAQMCGVDCLYAGLRVLGHDRSLAELERELPPGSQGVSLEAIRSFCRNNSVPTTPIQTDLDRLKGISNPVILHVNNSHYVALLGWEDGRMIVFDNRIGVYDCTPEWWLSWYRWEGTALIIGTPPPRVVFTLYGPSILLITGGLGLVGLAVVRIRRRKSSKPARAKTEVLQC